MQIRTLHTNELHLLFHFSRLEGWDTESIHSQTLFHLHPHDFFIAIKQKQVIGFIIALKYSSTFGFISNLLILKEFRGLGHGQELLSYALKHLKGCQIGLDSIVEKETIYQKFGFKSYFDLITYKFFTGSVMLSKSDLKVIDFDEIFSLKEKDSYMKEMISNKNISYKSIKKENQETSFAFSFSYIDGYKIHIESKDINEALTLFFALANLHNEGTVIYLQSSLLTPMIQAIVELLKMQVHTKYVRMYNFIP